MTATILDGRAMGMEIRAELREDIRRYIEARGQAPGLVIVRVEGDAASGVYTKAILRIASDIGVQARLESLPATASADELHALLLQLNSDSTRPGYHRSDASASSSVTENGC